jgi:hypothetical protein
MSKLSKKERHKIFKRMEGFYDNKTVFDYYKPDKNSTQKIQLYNWLHLLHIDSSKEYALYKGLQLIPKKEYVNLTPFNTSPDLDSSYAFTILGVVANYSKSTGEICLNFIDYDDKSSWSYRGINEKSFSGITTEFSLNSALKNDEYFFGGNVGGSSLKKMKEPLKDFQNIDFDTIYLERYNKTYPNNNNNNNDNIPLDTIATESAPGSGIWVINADVTISSTQKLAIDKGKYVTTIHNFTNNGTFINEGTFCTAKNFTNNDSANFNNNGGTTLIYLGGIFNNNGTIENKKGENNIGNIINLQSTYNLKPPGILIGEPVLIIQ